MAKIDILAALDVPEIRALVDVVQRHRVGPVGVSRDIHEAMTSVFLAVERARQSSRPAMSDADETQKGNV